MENPLLDLALWMDGCFQYFEAVEGAEEVFRGVQSRCQEPTVPNRELYLCSRHRRMFASCSGPVVP